MFKKILACILAAMFFLSVIPMAVSAAPYNDDAIVIGKGTTLIKAVEFDTDDFNESTLGRAEAGKWSWYFDAQKSGSNYAHRTEYQENQDGPQTEAATVADYGDIGAICYTHDDEWVQYTLEVETAGRYDVKSWIGTGAGKGKYVEIYFDGVLVGSPEAPNDGWGKYGLINTGTIDLQPGTVVLKLKWPVGDVNVAAFEVTLLRAFEPYKELVIGEGVSVIEAEDFDIGNYVDCTSPWSPAFAGRPDEKAATENCPNDKRDDAPDPNFNLGWISEGDWYKYTVNVEVGGVYNFAAWLASGSGAGNQGSIELYVNDKKIGSAAASKSTGWQDWDIYNVGDIGLSEGTYIFKALFPKGGANFDALVATLVKKYEPYKDINIGKGATIIEAEDFDIGNYVPCTSPWSPQFAGRPDEKVATENCPNDKRDDAPDPNYNVGWISEGDWVQYTVNVDVFGIYNFDAWLASGSGAGNQGGIELYVNDVKVGYAAATNSTGWQDWDIYTIGKTSLELGVNVIKAVFPKGGVNFDALVVTLVEDLTPPPEFNLDDAMTIGEAYSSAALLLAEFINPAAVLKNENFKLDVNNPLSLMAYAAKVGLLTEKDAVIYNQTFFKPSAGKTRLFNFDNLLNRQEYAGIIYRVFSILSKNGIEFTSGETISINGIQTQKFYARKYRDIMSNYFNGATKSNRAWHEYRDYGNLAGIYEVAFDFTLSTGIINHKTFDELDEATILGLGRNFKPSIGTNIIYDEEGAAVGRESFYIDKFLAPNETVSWNDMYENLMPFVMELNHSSYTRYGQFMHMLAPIIIPAPVAPEKPEEAGDAEEAKEPEKVEEPAVVEPAKPVEIVLGKPVLDENKMFRWTLKAADIKDMKELRVEFSKKVEAGDGCFGIIIHGDGGGWNWDAGVNDLKPGSKTLTIKTKDLKGWDLAVLGKDADKVEIVIYNWWPEWGDTTIVSAVLVP